MSDQKDHPSARGKRLSLAPLAHRVRRALQLDRSVAEQAVETHVFAPSQTGERPSAFWLPGQLDRVRAVQQETTVDFELSRIHGGTVVHDRTVGYRLENARLSKGVIYAGRTRWSATPEHERWAPRLAPRPPLYDRGALASSAVGNDYFGHFITDDCITADLANEVAPVVFANIGQERSEHAQRYLEIFELNPIDVVDADFRELWVFEDYAMTDHKRHRYEALRARVACAVPNRRTCHGVFFRRGRGGRQRNLQNEEALEEAVAREGYEIVDSLSQGLDEILEITRDASVVAGVEGSALCHGLLACAPDAALVCLIPPYRFNNVLKDHTDCLGMRYGFVVGEGGPDGWTLAPDMLLRTLELASS